MKGAIGALGIRGRRNRACWPGGRPGSFANLVRSMRPECSRRARDSRHGFVLGSGHFFWPSRQLLFFTPLLLKIARWYQRVLGQKHVPLGGFGTKTGLFRPVLAELVPLYTFFPGQKFGTRGPFWYQDFLRTAVPGGPYAGTRAGNSDPGKSPSAPATRPPFRVSDRPIRSPERGSRAVFAGLPGGRHPCPRTPSGAPSLTTAALQSKSSNDLGDPLADPSGTAEKTAQVAQRYGPPTSLRVANGPCLGRSEPNAEVKPKPILGPFSPGPAARSRGDGPTFSMSLPSQQGWGLGPGLQRCGLGHRAGRNWAGGNGRQWLGSSSRRPFQSRPNRGLRPVRPFWQGRLKAVGRDPVGVDLAGLPGSHLV